MRGHCQELTEKPPQPVRGGTAAALPTGRNSSLLRGLVLLRPLPPWEGTVRPLRAPGLPLELCPHGAHPRTPVSRGLRALRAAWPLTLRMRRRVTASLPGQDWGPGEFYPPAFCISTGERLCPTVSAYAYRSPKSLR